MKNFNFDLNDFFKHFGEELKTIFDEHEDVCDNAIKDRNADTKEKKTVKKWENGEIVENFEEEWKNGKCVKHIDNIKGKGLSEHTKSRKIPISSNNNQNINDRDFEALTKKYDKLIEDYDNLENDYNNLIQANQKLMEDKKFMTDELSNIFNEIQLCGDTWLKIGEALDYYNKHTANYCKNNIKTNNKKGE